MPKDQENLIWILVATAVSIVFRLKLITRDFWHDEAFQVRFAQEPLIKLLTGFDVHPPLFNLTTKALVWFTTDPLILRGCILLLSIVVGFVFFSLIKSLFNENVATWSYVLLMLSSTFAWYSTEFRSYMLVILLTLLQIRSFNRTLTSNSLSVGYIFLSVAMIYSHYMAGLVIFTQAIYLAVNRRINRFTHEFSIISILSIPLIIYILATLPRIESFWFKDIDINSFLSTFIYQVTPPQLWMFHIITVAVVGFLIYGLIMDHKTYKFSKTNSQLLFYIVLPVCVMWLISQSFAFYHHRYFMFGGIMVFAIAGQGLAVLNRNLRTTLVISLFALVMVVPNNITTPIKDACLFLEHQNTESYQTVHTSTFSLTPFLVCTTKMDSAYLLTNLTEQQLFSAGGSVINYGQRVYRSISDIPQSDNLYYVSDKPLKKKPMFESEGLYVEKVHA